MHRKIIITGVTQGLGQALTTEFIHAGHTVWGCGRSTESIDKMAQHYASPHAFAVVDISQASQVQAWAEQLLENHGSPDIVINNAGLINTVAPLWDIPAQSISDIIDVNIKGVIHVIRSFMPSMMSQKQGMIVNFSSGWGRSTSPGVAPYCASKWAVEGLTQALAQEIPSGITTVALNPGIIHTEMLETCFGEEAHHYPAPTAWAQQAVPYILNLSATDNGRALTVPLP